MQARVWGCPRVCTHTGKSKTGSSLSGDGGNRLLLTTVDQCSSPGAVLLRSDPGMGYSHVPCPPEQPDPLWGFTPPCFSPRHHPPHPRPDGFHHRGADLRRPAAPQQAGWFPCPFPAPCRGGAGMDPAPLCPLASPGAGNHPRASGWGVPRAGGVLKLRAAVPLPARGCPAGLASGRMWGWSLSPCRSTPPSTCCPPSPA